MRLEEKELSEVKEADNQFERGYSCAPSVLSAYSEQFGLEKELALKIACAFGGGIGRTGRTCGAVTGAVMVIGLKHGQADVADEESRQETHRLVKEFIDKFVTLHGSVECRELIGYDLSNPAEFELARGSSDVERKCRGFVHDAARILEDVLHLRQ
jgi:C_GCAxxG_C_C family probable redox protein